MNALDLYKFIYKNNVEYHWSNNNDDVILFIMEIPRTKGYTEIVKIAEAALKGEPEKARRYMNTYLLKFPESDLVYPFNALLNGNNNPSGLGHHDITGG